MNKFEKMYIISWFGNNEHSEKRYEIHQRQLEWCFSSSLQPVVLAQNYRDDQYTNNVEYIKHNGEVLKAIQARNVLLYQFYNSDEDFAVFADNDCYLYSGEKYGANDKFAEIIRNIPFENFENVDMLIGLDPATSPFTKDLQLNKQNDEVSWRLLPGFIASGFFILKNLKKHHNKEIYFDENFIKSDGSIIACEDQDFPIQLIHENMGVFICKNLIRKEEGATNSTWNNDRDSRRKRTTEGHDFISHKFKLPIQKTSGKGSWMKRFKSFNDKLRPQVLRLNGNFNNHLRNLFEGI